MKELLTNLFAFAFVGGGAFAAWSLGFAILRGDFKERCKDEK